MTKNKVASLHFSLALITALMVLGSSPRVTAGGVPVLSFASLVERSDAIVIAQTGDFHKVGEIQVNVHGQVLGADLMEASAEVKKPLKAPKGLTVLKVRFAIPVSPAGSTGYSTIPAQQMRLLFLKNGVNNSYEVADPYYPSLPAVENVSLSQSDDLEKEVANVECATVASTNANPDQRMEAIWSLKGRSDDCIVDALRAAFKASNQQLRLTSAMASLQRNDIGNLDATVSEIGQLSSDTYMRLNVLSAIRYGVKDQRAIPVLARMMQSQDAPERRAAASALRNIGSILCSALLAKALNDPDKDTRYYAVIGLAEIEDQPSHKPSMEDFDNDPTPFLRYWKDWAKSNIGDFK